MPDREPQPGDGPDFHADHAYWKAHQENVRTMAEQTDTTHAARVIDAYQEWNPND